MGYMDQVSDIMGLDFSDAQKEIIRHKGSPANVISCAGSGKTTLLIASLIYRQLEGSINPEKTCVISFNRTAVDEIENRYKESVKNLNLEDNITFKTFHALYYMLLRYYYSIDGRELHVLGEGQAMRLFNNAFYSLSKDKSDENKEAMWSLRGYVVNNLISSKNQFLQTSKFLTSGVDPEDYFNVIALYRDLKNEIDAVDFEDLQLQTLKLLRDNRDARERVQQAWEYWFIDEYQDISRIQMDILKLSMKDENNLVTIGDEDQSIYEFRGSKVDYIVDFPIYFKNSKRYIMDTNYRCPENILEKAEKLIKNNKKRIDKDMKAYNKGGEVTYKSFSSSVEEAIYVVNEIYDDFVKGKDLKEIAVLYRNNNQSMYIVDQMINKGIPFNLNRNGGRLYDHLFIRDFINVVNFAEDDKDPLLFKNNFNKITKYVNKTEVNRIANEMTYREISWRELVDFDNSSIGLASIKLQKIKELVDSKGNLSDILDIFLEVYDNHLSFLTTRGKFKEEEIDELVLYLNEVYGGNTFKEFIYCIDRANSVISLYKDRIDTVSLKTMHTVKGLEYDKVFIIGANDDVVPNNNIEEKIIEIYGVDEAKDYVEQERRLFYVACTRAKKELIITNNVLKPSRFVLELGVD